MCELALSCRSHATRAPVHIPLPQFSATRGNFFSFLKKTVLHARIHTSSPYPDLSSFPSRAMLCRQNRLDDESLLKIIEQAEPSTGFFLTASYKETDDS